MHVAFRIQPSLLGRFEQHFAAGMRAQRILKAFEQAGKRIVDVLRVRTEMVLYKGRYRGGWRTLATSNVLIVLNDQPHAIFVEAGRRPGKAPPLPVIREWVLSKGMDAGAAFPIARKIARDGIKGRPAFFAEDMQKLMGRIVRSETSTYLDKLLVGAASK